jgi:flavin reductase (DIM6/NTAB) family NADH-FMN oxidoreductase RutF
VASDDAYFYRTSEGSGLPHDPVTAIVGPRPIGWISSISRDGVNNLAPYSFFNVFNYWPPLVGFASVGWKDTVANIEANGEFVWNLATRPLAEAMNATSALFTAEADEFDRSGLTPVPARAVKPARVLESPVNFECKLTQMIQLQGDDGAAVRTWLTLGQVIAVHIDNDMLVDGVYDTARAQPILRAGKLGDYVEVRRDAMFEMTRPSW